MRVRRRWGEGLGEDMANRPSAGAGRVFISYRREETAYPAGWLFDRLTDRFGEKQIFKDIDSIEPGDDFVQTITDAVGSCDVLLALIGDEWLTIADGHGRRRLDDVNDFVRLEIEAALSRNVRVIPILVQGARMPRVEELPASLAGLVRRQALELSPNRFATDLDRLLRVLERTLADAPGARSETAAGESSEARPAASVRGPHRSSPGSLLERLPAVVSTPARVGAAVLVLLIVLIMAIVLTRGESKPPAEGEPSSSEEAPASEGAWPAPSELVVMVWTSSG